MTFDEFIGEVQSRAGLPSLGDAVKAVRAVLETLGERLPLDEVRNLAAQLPGEIAYYLRQRAAFLEKFDLDGFFNRVSRREPVALPDAVGHARVVISVLSEAVSDEEFVKVRALLPNQYGPLFTAVMHDRMKKAA